MATKQPYDKRRWLVELRKVREASVLEITRLTTDDQGLNLARHKLATFTL